MQRNNDRMKCISDIKFTFVVRKNFIFYLLKIVFTKGLRIVGIVFDPWHIRRHAGIDGRHIHAATDAVAHNANGEVSLHHRMEVQEGRPGIKLASIGDSIARCANLLLGQCLIVIFHFPFAAAQR